MSTKFFAGLLVLVSVLHAAPVWADDEAKVFENYSSIVELEGEQDGLTAEERKTLFQRASANPVSNLNVVGKYDPKGIIGFCFGRATSVHLTARKMGLKEGSIRKLFIIGDLRSNPATPEWRFHVTTLVKGSDRKWYAIDPIMTQPIGPGRDMPVKNWIETVRKVWDYKKTSYLYVTSAAAAVPDIRVDADGTTGEHVIELAFDPNETDGFKKVKLGGIEAYQPNEEQEAIHFLQPSAEEVANRFEFLQIEVPGLGAISYNNYFVDLLKTFTGRVRSFALQSAAESVELPKVTSHKENCPEAMGAAKATTSSAPNLHSFRLGGQR